MLAIFRDAGFDPDMIGLRNNQFVYLLVLLVLLVINILLIWFFIRQNKSRVGRAFAAIKMDEKAAEAMGINITYYKVLAFTQGPLPSFAGALFAHVMAYISPADFLLPPAGRHSHLCDISVDREVIWGPVFGASF